VIVGYICNTAKITELFEFKYVKDFECYGKLLTNKERGFFIAPKEWSCSKKIRITITEVPEND